MTDATDYKPARCSFYVRLAVKGGYRYDHARTAAQHPGTELVTICPPRVGEMISLLVLNPRGDEVSYNCRVVDIGHTYPSIGSVNWNRGDVGPRLEIIAERADEWLFRDEAPLDDD